MTINNSTVVIIFSTTSKLLGKKPQSGIALTLFIEILDKELLKYEVEKNEMVVYESWRKGPHSLAAEIHAYFVTGSLLRKGATV